ncbi:decarboxylase family protein [Ketogulonicigenium robustum]|uniref:Cytokinin riboside 5'-monophosphate phosphoribohydrolase n=1 Tax=Ketogulonicigenium robustum TaxID=92947 RepID=A0A1W6NZG3_9RHOB|nr:TIGR00730 family Rossman fold protein [Ketogulonicigenium robustum]ARO14561.1 decarboxylase family protein [Ketogulonicigenium robustum]
MVATTKAVCVYCGSRNGKLDHYAELATETGAMIARNHWALIYGAGDVGLMGLVARGTQEAGGAAVGVIPTHLMKREVGRRELDRLIITETMHERKKVMFMNADAIIVLPGGAGTLDEYFEVLTWRQIGLHQKPIFLLNVDGFWDPLLQLLRNIVDQGFAEPSLLDYTTAVSDVAAIEAALQVSFAP